MAEHEGVLPATEEVERARELFGLGPAPTRREVIQAWRDAARLAHPDLAGPDSTKTAERLMQRINEAREVLLDALPPPPPTPPPDVFAEAGLYESLWTDDPDAFDDSAAPPVPYPKNGRALARRGEPSPPDMTPLRPRLHGNGSSTYGQVPRANVPIDPQAVVEPVPPVRPVPPAAAPVPRPPIVAPVPPTPPRSPVPREARSRPQPGVQGHPDAIRSPSADASNTAFAPPGNGHGARPVSSAAATVPGHPYPQAEIPLVGPTGAPAFHPGTAPAPAHVPAASAPPVAATASPPPERVEEPTARWLSARNVTLVFVAIGVAIVIAVLAWVASRDAAALEPPVDRPAAAIRVASPAYRSPAVPCDDQPEDAWTRM